MSDTYERLVGLLVQVCGLETEEITPEADFRALEVDSLALVELTLAAQKEFDVAIGDDDLQPQNSIAEAARVIEAKVAGSDGVTA